MQNRLVAALAVAGALLCASCAAQPAAALDLAAQMRPYIGTNPGRWSFAYCARILNTLLQMDGLPTTGSDLAGSFLRYGRRLPGPQHGAIVVLTWRHKRADHVAVVEGVGPDGIHVIGGNQHLRGVPHLVSERVVQPRNVLAFVEPSGVASAAAAVPWPVRASYAGRPRHHHHRWHHRRRPHHRHWR